MKYMVVDAASDRDVPYTQICMKTQSRQRRIKFRMIFLHDFQTKLVPTTVHAKVQLMFGILSSLLIQPYGRPTIPI